MKKRYCFNKEEHIRAGEEFRNVFKARKSFVNAYTVMYVHDRKDLKTARLGWILSKKMGKAHDRIRTKRLIREVYRLNKEELQKGLDIVLLPRRKIVELKKYAAIKGMLFAFWRECRVLKQ